MKKVKSNMASFCNCCVVKKTILCRNSISKLNKKNLFTIIQLQNSLFVYLILVLNLIYVILDLNKF